jgi:epsilon-lactone hydrolase
MTTASLSIGEQILLDHYRASNAANRAGLTSEAAREFDRRWGDVATEPGGVDYVETEAAGVRAMWLRPVGSEAGKVLLCLHGGIARISLFGDPRAARPFNLPDR